MMTYLDASTGSTAVLSIFGLIFWVGIIALYWLPTIIAWRRHHHNTATIAIVDGLLGWTFIGWVVALAMSFGNPAPQPTQITHVYQHSDPPSSTPSVGTMTPVNARTSNQQTCRSCGQPSGTGKFCQNCGAPLAPTV